MKRTLGMMFFAGALLSLGAGPASAETSAEHQVLISVDEVAMLALDSDLAVKFDIGSPTEAGGPFAVTASGDTEKYLRYTSIAEAGKELEITAQLDTNLPDGLRLIINATDAAGNCGNLGNAAAKTVLSDKDSEVIVSDIGSGYTGTGATDGVKLQYSLDSIDCEDDACEILVGDTTVTVTYTLSTQS